MTGEVGCSIETLIHAYAHKSGEMSHCDSRTETVLVPVCNIIEQTPLTYHVRGLFEKKKKKNLIILKTNKQTHL